MIDIKDISVKTRGGSTLLSDLSVSFAPGKLHAIIGPNGSGKTTLLKVISGLIRPTSGTVFVNNKNIHLLPAIEIATQLSYVEAEHTSPFAYTVLDTILWGRWPQHQGHPRKTDYDRASVAAEQVGIADMTQRSLTTLSLGERKKAHLAKSVGSDAPYLVWDEPLAPLDIRSSLEVISLLRQLASSGTTILISLHDITLAPRFADTVTILGDKKVTWQGSPDDSDCLSKIADTFEVRVTRIAGDAAWSVKLPAR